ncbi:MAG: hypothetical protein HN597_14935 [Desulfobacula sp.]|jgi:hypothetical protein|uniref:Uncharacterized protein n=1 Tax=uncultured marine virus TaxID=186617 RepID=A0A0F7L698_9VIRU|nr:hypothetical protein [uncultured marine virus]MBT7630978.1 hypothetical protein [Desulfobacula sp.]
MIIEISDNKFKKQDTEQQKEYEKQQIENFTRARTPEEYMELNLKARKDLKL